MRNGMSLALINCYALKKMKNDTFTTNDWDIAVTYTKSFLVIVPEFYNCVFN